MSILVLALNPSIDAEWRVRDVQWEEKNTIESERRWAGGKGVNVARWLLHLGNNPHLVLPLGGSTGIEMEEQLRSEGLAHTVVSLAHSTRVNIIVTTAAGRQMRFNPLGPKLNRSDWNAFFEQVEQFLPSSRCVVLSGSLPRQAPVGTYARLLRMVRASGGNALLDCDGPAFAAAVGSKPFLVKPNQHELSQWAGLSLSSDNDVRSAAKRLSHATRGWVLVSRGARGAILVNAGEGKEFLLRVPPVKTLNTVGAGDAMLAAVAHQVEQGSPPEEWLRWGAATGTVATQSPAGVLPKLNAVRKLADSLDPRKQR